MIWLVLVVEILNYYLEWFNVYNWVIIDLIIYDVGGIIELDVKFVIKVNSFVD